MCHHFGKVVGIDCALAVKTDCDEVTLAVFFFFRIVYVNPLYIQKDSHESTN